MFLAIQLGNSAFLRIKCETLLSGLVTVVVSEATTNNRNGFVMNMSYECLLDDKYSPVFFHLFISALR